MGTFSCPQASLVTLDRNNFTPCFFLFQLPSLSFIFLSIIDTALVITVLCLCVNAWSFYFRLSIKRSSSGLLSHYFLILSLNILRWNRYAHTNVIASPTFNTTSVIGGSDNVRTFNALPHMIPINPNFRVQ